ncbi:hypothetical protein SLS58_005724 [Diplodia intermedia]|uniref:Uncharacterized protein n=1 Tax=Diplodia intermedia TaxID=856260 RepID=A0ABR3TPV6_9PEZI
MAASQQQSTRTHVSVEEKPCPSVQSSENTLCELCLQALILDDARAGGSIQESPDGASTALDFSGFATDEFNSYSGVENRYEVYRDRWRKVDQFGWQNDHSTDVPDSYFRLLKQLFLEEYQQKPWWQAPSSIIRFRIRYGWDGRRSKQDLPQYDLRALAVIIRHPGNNEDMAEMFQFAVGALPAMLRKVQGLVENLPIPTGR